MGMVHKAFAFDWLAFEASDLYGIVLQALASGGIEELTAYIEAHRSELKDPYEGDPLPEDWQDLLESRDVHELTDFALTQFYDPAEDGGLWYQWRAIQERLPEADQEVLLGTALESEGNCFDAGRLGSYFQTPSEVQDSLNRLRQFQLPDLDDDCQESLDRFQELLEECVEADSGLYVTF
jgi:hypothetical protein